MLRRAVMARTMTILRSGIETERDTLLGANLLHIDGFLVRPGPVIYKFSERSICLLIVGAEESFVHTSRSILLDLGLELIGDFRRFGPREEHQRHCVFEVTQGLLMHVGVGGEIRRCKLENWIGITGRVGGEVFANHLD